MPRLASELVFGFVYGVGTDVDPVITVLKDYLKQYKYQTHDFRISEYLKSASTGIEINTTTTYDRMSTLMDAGNRVRTDFQSGDVLAITAVRDIASKRKLDEKNNPKPSWETAHLVRSLKTPEEVRLLREIYRPGFFLIGIASDDDEQVEYLSRRKGLTEEQARQIMARDQDEEMPFGQRTRDTFYLADVFVQSKQGRFSDQLDRFIELVFGHPFKTPRREEQAMFMAYAAAARSAQLGRQVGAAVATPNGEVVAVGCNEVPSPSGGSYWENDTCDQRDHRRSIDSNFEHRSKIVRSIQNGLTDHLLDEVIFLKIEKELTKTPNPDSEKLLEDLRKRKINETQVSGKIHSSELKDITEYGRAVHAEMDALLTCTRLGIGVKGLHLFTTTFPCHNCTRHIIAAGITKVTYIEPYPKSKAADLHQDAITFEDVEHGTATQNQRIPFVPFVGVGPRRYLDLFSLELSTGSAIRRKDESGKPVEIIREQQRPRVSMLPYDYLESEVKLLDEHKLLFDKLNGVGNEQRGK